MTLVFIIVALSLTADQLVKWWTVSNLALGQTAPLLSPVMSLQYVRNPGAAWGILAGQQWLFTIITIIVIGSILIWLMRNKQAHWTGRLGAALVLAGGIGNFIDRLRFGYVIDMFRFDFIDFPIFNVADACLTCGVAVLFIYLMFFEKKAER